MTFYNFGNFVFPSPSVLFVNLAAFDQDNRESVEVATTVGSFHMIGPDRESAFRFSNSNAIREIPNAVILNTKIVNLERVVFINRDSIIDGNRAFEIAFDNGNSLFLTDGDADAAVIYFNSGVLENIRRRGANI